MDEEREWDVPEWEIPEEKIPPSLESKWIDDEKRGIRASVCHSCGFPFTEEDLSCRHCGISIEVDSGFISQAVFFFTKTPWGIITIIIMLLSFVGLMF